MLLFNFFPLYLKEPSMQHGPVAYSQRSFSDSLTHLQNAQEISYANSKWKYMPQHVCSRQGRNRCSIVAEQILALCTLTSCFPAEVSKLHYLICLQGYELESTLILCPFEMQKAKIVQDYLCSHWLHHQLPHQL